MNSGIQYSKIFLKDFKVSFEHFFTLRDLSAMERPAKCAVLFSGSIQIIFVDINKLVKYPRVSSVKEGLNGV